MCTQHATNSCCTGLHDHWIQMSIHSDSQDSTPDLRNYMCFGCNAKQPSYTDEDAQTIRICQKYAERLWSGKELNGVLLDTPQNIYDTFGLQGKNGKDIFIQSKDFKNAAEFFD